MESSELDTTVSIITRTSWDAKTCKWLLTPLKTPVDNVVCVSTYHDLKSTPPYVEAQRIQSKQMAVRTCPDIKYNFLIHEDGRVYEGRGFMAIPCLPRRYGRFGLSSIYVGLMGDFIDPPPEPMLQGLHNLIYYAVANGFVNSRFLLHYL